MDIASIFVMKCSLTCRIIIDLGYLGLLVKNIEREQCRRVRRGKTGGFKGGIQKMTQRVG